MDAVELPLPAAIVTKIMRSSGCSGGGGVTRVELLGNQSERETCSSSFHPDTDDKCNVNGSRPAFWNMMSDYRQASQSASLRNEEAFIDHDMASVPEAKQSQRKSGKAARSNGSSSRRSRAAHMEASLNVTGVVDVNDQSKELGSYPGKCSIAEKTHTAKQKTTISGKRSDKRNGKVSKSKCDSFSVKVGLSSFSSAAGGNNILGVYGSKHDICDFAKHVDELSLNELLGGSCKCPKSIKDKEKETEILNGSILQSVRQACSILQLQKPNHTPNVAAIDGAYNHNASSCLPNSATSGASTNEENKGDVADPASSNKVENSCSGLTDHTILKFPLFAPKDVLGRLALPPPKDLDLMLLDNMKPSSTSKVHNGGTLPTFPWSHVSGGHFKANPDVVKSTPSKSTCQGRWVRMRNSTTSLGDTTTYLADFESLTYNQSLVPLGCQQPGPIEKEKSPLPSISDITFDGGLTPSGSRTTSKSPAPHSGGVLAAAQTLCDIASRFRKQDQNGTVRWQKKSSQKTIKASKLTSDEKLEKALFAIPSSRSTGPTNPIDDANKTHNTTKKLKLSVTEKINDPNKTPYHWSQSNRSSPMKSFKNTASSTEAAAKQHHESSSSSPMKRSITTPPARLPHKPPKLRKLVPMEWKSQKGNGNGKY
ncbi:uncharacterized protein LOC112527960 isoform X1 [Cynara cardunculus var. scolymus]|uniref:uncharacterized protein LOC112527960 isoform X1 n=1 Tax=Cynara cardunculus var. scolymus TaxID=59895 RepID=UPI000D62D077|nr:uncharacterized protein LOC112527960 isoform X1 [Cynara cardunculus var. scolymus]